MGHEVSVVSVFHCVRQSRVVEQYCIAMFEEPNAGGQISISIMDLDKDKVNPCSFVYKT